MTTIDGTNLSTLAGRPVRSSHGAKIGKVVDVHQSVEGTGTFLSVSTGRFASTHSFVPLAGATMDGDCVVVPYGHHLVKDGPSVGAGGELSVADEEQLYRHYGLSPTDLPPPDISEQVPEIQQAARRRYVVTSSASASHDRIRVEREVVTETDLLPATSGREPAVRRVPPARHARPTPEQGVPPTLRP